MRTLFRFFSMMVLSTVLFSCNHSETKIVLLHTNDVHGEISNFAKVAALKQEMLEKYDTVFLLSAGDMFSGNPFIDYYDEQGFPMLEMMNLAGYDLATLGNHEFDYGQETLKKRLDQANFPIIAANVDVSGVDFSSNFMPSYQFVYKDLTLEFHGVLETHNNGKPSTHPAKIEGINFTDPFEMMKSIRKSENADYAFLMNHLGYYGDSVIATKYPEFPVIIGAHSHTYIDSLNLINNVLVVQAGDDLDNIGKIELTFKKGKLVDRNYEVIDLNAYQNINKEIEKVAEEYLSNPKLNEVLGSVVSPFENMYEIGCLLTDAQTSIHNLDFAIQNYYGIRVYEIPVGEITTAMVYEADPFGNELIVFDLTKEEFKSLLANAYKYSKRKDLLISGGTYSIIVDENKDFIDLEVKDRKGQALKSNNTYKVGLNSYIANSYKFDHKDKGTGTSTTTAENIIKFIQNEKELDYNGCERISIVQQQ